MSMFIYIFLTLGLIYLEGTQFIEMKKNKVFKTRCDNLDERDRKFIIFQFIYLFAFLCTSLLLVKFNETSYLIFTPDIIISFIPIAFLVSRFRLNGNK